MCLFSVSWTSVAEGTEQSRIGAAGTGGYNPVQGDRQLPFPACHYLIVWPWGTVTSLSALAPLR